MVNDKTIKTSKVLQFQVANILLVSAIAGMKAMEDLQEKFDSKMTPEAESEIRDISNKAAEADHTEITKILFDLPHEELANVAAIEFMSGPMESVKRLSMMACISTKRGDKPHQRLQQLADQFRKETQAELNKVEEEVAQPA